MAKKVIRPVYHEVDDIIYCVKRFKKTTDITWIRRATLLCKTLEHFIDSRQVANWISCYRHSKVKK
jgi:hypothetical protein